MNLHQYFDFLVCRVHIYDLYINKYTAICVQAVVPKKRVSTKPNQAAVSMKRVSNKQTKLLSL